MSIYKKTIILTLLIFSSFSFVSCDFFFEYSGKDSGLFYEIAFSVAGIENKDINPIRIIETDDYDRSLYYMDVDYFQVGGCVGNFMAILIAQQLTDDTVYYYEDVNYILIDLSGRTSDESNIDILDQNQDRIDNLKAINDWNEELDLSKCYTKPANDFERDFSDIEDSIGEYVIENILHEIYRKDYRTVFAPLDYKTNMYIMTVYVDVWPDEEVDYGYYDMYFVIYTKNGTGYEADYIRVDNVFDYSSQLQEIKNDFGWY